MNRLVCFDSIVVIWGIKKKSTEGQEDMIIKTEKFISHLDKSSTQILIPSVVLAEILSTESKENQNKFLKIISSNFIIGDFNKLTAKIFAELFNENIEFDKKIRTENEIRKDKMKLDYMIVASAIEHNASCIYSNDKKHLERFAKDKIKILDIPSIPEQTVLFK
jgi:predicted nucleic acid-binding protein